MAVGNTSLDDWPMLTWSLGWTFRPIPRSPPISSLARLAITSLTFMFVWVPLPVCQTTRGNSASCRPAITSSAAAMIASADRGILELPQVEVHLGRRAASPGPGRGSGRSASDPRRS